MRGGGTRLSRRPAWIGSLAGVLLRLRLPDVSEPSARASGRRRGPRAGLLFDDQSRASGGGAGAPGFAGGPVPARAWTLFAIPQHAAAAHRAPVAATVFFVRAVGEPPVDGAALRGAKPVPSPHGGCGGAIPVVERAGAPGAHR